MTDLTVTQHNTSTPYLLQSSVKSLLTAQLIGIREVLAVAVAVAVHCVEHEVHREGRVIQRVTWGVGGEGTEGAGQSRAGGREAVRRAVQAGQADTAIVTVLLLLLLHYYC